MTFVSQIFGKYTGAFSSALIPGFAPGIIEDGACKPNVILASYDYDITNTK
jgi:hypothetical protein